MDVTYLNVDEFGKISLEELENAIRPETVLISVMFANNEIGTIQPIAEIAEIAKKHGVLFHTDAVQAVGHVPIDVEKLHVDLLSMSGHKLGAPKGIGAIYIRKGTRISPLIFGGAQEKKLRAGTENIAGIVGLGKAAELAVAEMEETTKKLTALRDKLIHGILESIPDSRTDIRQIVCPATATFPSPILKANLCCCCWMHWALRLPAVLHAHPALWTLLMC